MILPALKDGLLYDAFVKTDAIQLSADERRELQTRSRSRAIRADDVRRARLILMLDAGNSYQEIQRALPCDATYISRWKKRFIESRIAGPYRRHKGSKAEVLTPKMEARIITATGRKPVDGSTHWSTRQLAKHLRVSHILVARVWMRARLQPHRIERYIMSIDPDFEKKAADIIALYVNPPQHAAVFSVDEKTAIQALDRKDPVLPMSPGRAERHGFEYYRHGTISLYAALNTKSGKVLGQTAAHHTTEEFVAFLGQIVALQPKAREIHIIADNLSAHKTKRVAQVFADHPQVHLQFTPTYSSWLNQVELWFGRIQRDVVARGVFTSVNDLARKLMLLTRPISSGGSAVL